jgi:two-component system NarL family sensor kinase
MNTTASTEYALPAFPVKNYHLLNKVTFTLLFILCNLLNAFAQQRMPLKDTNDIVALIAKGAAQTDKLPTEAFNDLQFAIKSSENIQFTKGVAKGSVKLARWYFGNDIDSAISMGLLALQKFEQSGSASVDDLAEAHLLLSEAYDESGKKDSSAYYYYLLGEELTAGNLTDPEFAVTVFTKLSIFWINFDFGFLPSNEYRNTILRFVDKAKEASTKIKDTANGRSSIYFIQGAYYHSIKNYDSARYYYNIYYVERERLKLISTSRKISTLSNIADTYLQENNPTEALKYVERIRAMGQDPDQQKYLAFFLSFIDLQAAKAHYQMGHYKSTIEILDKALADLSKTGSHLRNEVVESYDIYANSYQALGNYQKAFEYKNLYVKLSDSLSKKDKVDIIGRMEVRNRMAEKDKELALQKLRLSEVNSKVRDKNFLIGGISLVAFSGIVIFGLWRKKNISKQKLQEGKIDNLQQKIKIERLKASINAEERERTRIGRELHDGVGGLLSVARMNFELAKKTNNNDANADFSDGLHLLEEATVELRQAAYNLMPEILLNQGLASAVQAFCEKMTSKSSTNIAFQAIGERKQITSAFDLPVYRIIQELVHNIIKHADAKHALVQLNFQEAGALSITVEDDGIGLPPDAFENSKGMGLKNLKERLTDLGGKLDVQSTPEAGTSIYLEFDSLQDNIETA